MRQNPRLPRMPKPAKQAKISELSDMIEGYREMADENRRIADEFLGIQRDVVLSIDKELDIDDIGDDMPIVTDPNEYKDLPWWDRPGEAVMDDNLIPDF